MSLGRRISTFATQTKAVIENVRDILGSVGAQLRDVVEDHYVPCEYE